MSRIQLHSAQIRSASRSDGPRLSLIANATFLETFAGEIAGDALVAQCVDRQASEQFARQLETGSRAWLVEIERSPIGYAMLSPPQLECAHDGDIELKKIYLLSRYHGSGIAARLLETAIAGAKGYRRILLGVKADNHRAINFYRKHGFAQIGTRRFDVGGTLYDDVVLARDCNGNTAQ